MGRKKSVKRFRSVAKAMQAKGLNDAQVATLIGCDRSLITRIRGGQKFLSLRRPLKIATLLEVPVESL